MKQTFEIVLRHSVSNLSYSLASTAAKLLFKRMFKKMFKLHFHDPVSSRFCCERSTQSYDGYPAVKGTLWTRIGLGLAHYGPVLGIEQFLIKRTLSRCFPRTHANTPVRKHTPVEGNCGNVCLIRCLFLDVLFSKRIIINEFRISPIRFHHVPFTAGKLRDYVRLIRNCSIPKTG